MGRVDIDHRVSYAIAPEIYVTLDEYRIL